MTTDLPSLRREDPAALNDLRAALAETARVPRDVAAIRERVWRDRDRTAGELVRLRGERARLIDHVRGMLAEEKAVGHDASDGAAHAFWNVLEFLGANTAEDDKGIVA